MLPKITRDSTVNFVQYMLRSHGCPLLFEEKEGKQSYKSAFSTVQAQLFTTVKFKKDKIL